MSSDPTSPSPKVREAAEALKAAIDTHLAAVEKRSGENDPTVHSTYDELRRAGLAYDDILFDTYEEVTPFEVAEPPLDVTAEVAEDGGPHRLALMSRFDFTISDAESVVEAGRAAFRQAGPEDADVTADEQVSHVGSALYELANAFGLEGLEERAEDVGLLPEGSTTWVLDVRAPDARWRDAAFAAAEFGRVLYRLDEVYDEDDDEDE